MQVKFGDLFAAYQRWAEAASEKPLGSKTFADLVRRYSLFNPHVSFMLNHFADSDPWRYSRDSDEKPFRKHDAG